MGNAIADIRSSFCNQSKLGILCVAFLLDENKLLSFLETDAIWVRLSEYIDTRCRFSAISRPRISMQTKY
jgi:hypothetical protein